MMNLTLRNTFGNGEIGALKAQLQGVGSKLSWDEVTINSRFKLAQWRLQLEQPVYRVKNKSAKAHQLIYLIEENPKGGLEPRELNVSLDKLNSDYVVVND